jgi:hypothetical protein
LNNKTGPNSLPTFATLLSPIVFAVILLVFMTTGAMAQYALVSVSGAIRAEDKSPIPGVKVQLIQKETTTQVFTDTEGNFVYHFAHPGHLEIRFEQSSIGVTGSHEVVAYPGQFFHLDVVLLKQRDKNGKKNPWDIKEIKDVPNAWEAERVLTEARLESYPSVLHLWALLNHTELNIVADRYDVSGMQSSRQFLLGIRGSSYTQNQASVNGIALTHPTGDGMLAFPDISTMQTIVYTIGGSPSHHVGTGGHLTFIPKTGGRKIHGHAHLYFQSGALQNVNPTERLRFFGITESDERWRHFINANFQIGGPLGGIPWTYFGSVSVRDSEKRIREHSLPVSATVTQEAFNLSGDLSERSRLFLYWAGQQVSEPQANASPQITREASLDRNQRYHSLTAAWTHRYSSTSLLDARFGIVTGSVHSRPQPGIERQNREDLFPGFVLNGVPDPPDYLEMVAMLYNTTSGAPSLVTNSDGTAIEANVGFSTVRDGFENSNHQISIAASFRRSSLTQKHTAIDDLNLLFFEGLPESVRLLNTPVRMRDRIHHLEFHAADTVTLSHLSLSAGIYGSISNGINILSSGVSTNSLNWYNLSGRIGIAYNLWSGRRFVINAVLARTYNQPLTGTWAAINPEGLGFERHSWVDTNQDLQYQPGEDAGVLKVYGSPHNRLDSSLKNPHIDEINLGFSTGGHGIALHLLGFIRAEKNLISLVNKGVPASSYTPVQVWDPGPDGDLTDGGDDKLVTAYRQDPTTLGKDWYLLTNPPGHKGHSEGFELKLSYTLSGFQVEASVMRYRAVAAAAPGMLAVDNDTSTLLGIFDDPNKAILARGSTYFDRGTVSRFWAIHDLGFGIKWSVVVSYLDGLPYSRYLPIKGFPQGVFGILTRQRGPGDSGSFGGYRTVHCRNIDLRVIKEFAWGRGRLSAVLDIFNIENRAEALLQTDVTAPTHLWRIPLRFQTPRSIQLGLRYVW